MCGHALRVSSFVLPPRESTRLGHIPRVPQGRLPADSSAHGGGAGRALPSCSGLSVLCPPETGHWLLGNTPIKHSRCGRLLPRQFQPDQCLSSAREHDHQGHSAWGPPPQQHSQVLNRIDGTREGTHRGDVVAWTHSTWVGRACAPGAHAELSGSAPGEQLGGVQGFLV